FIGPVIMALIVALWREWVHEEDHRIPEPEPKKAIKTKRKSSAKS
ncbi:MAG: AI-2E family transporter, partial [Xanthomonadaceae bacterium]|nr:AI-2E family transporter [Xanthomonadaceae bacterium]